MRSTPEHWQAETMPSAKQRVVTSRRRFRRRQKNGEYGAGIENGHLGLHRQVDAQDSLGAFRREFRRSLQTLIVMVYVAPESKFPPDTSESGALSTPDPY